VFLLLLETEIKPVWKIERITVGDPAVRIDFQKTE
jgi:hypothetical protein